MDSNNDRIQLLDAAEQLFYERGYQTVGMDALREASGLPLKRIYSLFQGKDQIAVAMLQRRDKRWIASLEQHIGHEEDPSDQLLAVFDWLESWLSREGHRGCAWINAFGELGAVSPGVTQAVRDHKNRLKSLITDLAGQAGASQETADAIFLLAEGAMVTAGISGRPDVAIQARRAAQVLLAA